MTFASITDESFFREIVTATAEGIIAVDGKGRVVFANAAVERILGYEPVALVEGPVDRVFPDGHERPPETLRNLADQALTEGGIAELSLVHNDGHEVPVVVTSRAVDHGGTRFFTVTFREVSERTRQPDAVRNVELRKVFEYSNDAILIFDPEADEFKDCNPRACEMLGYSREELLSQSPSDIHPHELPAFREFAQEVLDEGEGWTDELSCYTYNGETLPSEISASVIEMDGRPHVLAFIRDISERRQREREVYRRSAAMEAVTDGMAILNEDEEFVYVNEAYLDIHGYDERDSLLGEPWEQLYDEDQIKHLKWDVFPAVWNSGSWRGELTGMRPDGTTFPQEVTLTELDDGGVVWVVRDITERKERERQLESLTEVARELMRADTTEEIAEIGAQAAGRILGFDIVCIRSFNQETERLERVALTDEAQELIESQTAYDLEATHAGRAFREEEIVVNEISDDDGYDRTSAYSSLHVPIGTDGALSVIIGAGEEFEDHHVDLAEVLSVTIRTAIAQAEQEQLLRKHETELRQQRDQLETLNRINTLIQEIGEHLTEAGEREELERMICERLVASDLYGSAWIGAVEVTEEHVDPRTSAGLNESYLDALSRMEVSMLGNGTVMEAIETGEIQVVRQYQLSENESLTDGDFGEDSEGLEAIAAIPITYGDRVHGVLVVNGTREDLFSDEALSGFESLGRMIGFAMNAISNRELLLSDTVVELEFEVTDSSVFYNHVTEELDCRCRFERSIPREGGAFLNYHVIDGADPEPVLELAEDSEQIEEADIVSEREDGVVIRTVTEQSSVQLALQTGATIQSAVAEDGEARVTVEAPVDADLREIANAFEAAYSSVDLVAKQEIERSLQTVDEFRETIDDELTEKQRSALESAYTAGYYDWPRDINAEELAESMDITSATLHQHLRNGERKLLSAFLEEN